MKKRSFCRVGTLAVAVFMAISPDAFAQEGLPPEPVTQDPRILPPRVYGAGAALYPMEAEAAGIEGAVRLRVFTDGPRVINVEVEEDSGHPELVEAARRNVMTWRFPGYTIQTTFPVTYRNILVDGFDDGDGEALNWKTVMRFPTEVEVYAVRPKAARHPAAADRPESPRP